jgi:hypothetical protein
MLTATHWKRNPSNTLQYAQEYQSSVTERLSV